MCPKDISEKNTFRVIDVNVDLVEEAARKSCMLLGGIRGKEGLISLSNVI